MYGLIIGRRYYTDYGNQPKNPDKPDDKDKPVFNDIDNALDDMIKAKELFKCLGMQEFQIIMLEDPEVQELHAQIAEWVKIAQCNRKLANPKK